MNQHFKLFRNCIIFILLFYSYHGYADSGRNRAQYPGFLSNTFYGINLGYLNFPFTNKHLEEGFEAEYTKVPQPGVRLTLYGRQINEYFAVKISYMRPVFWATYHNINGEETRNSVWMNVAGLTLKPQYPINDNISLFGEAGMSIVTRHGFNRDDRPAVKDANYAYFLFSGGMKYHLNDKWDLMVHAAYSPANNKVLQPYTFFLSPGFQYNIKPLPDERLKEIASTGYVFPKHQLTFEYSTNTFGYGVNRFVARRTIPIFWAGSVEVETAWSVNYQRNIFHTKSVFSLDFGASAAYFETCTHNTQFYTLSLYPVFRLTFLRTQPADLYFFYILGGPTYISKSQIDGVDTGEKFTFHDYMGIGMYAGKSRNIITELKIGHYSNGNIFPQNAGVMIPLTLAVGYAF